ncbi:YIP1 family protein [Candidatus Aminicenantes bacterium AC-335-B20]|jgi:hypothetical protein|nr:YIP1 family protein [SCandidatus Aminicenantes bacterium Aminicenantia_JdfR_composite]MCP2596697.1 YIP1 family protein [Candidatus Aminicenantes bacterium AC-335-G13]MCP2598940.1 YIP1 family protein [Candidatus Aminicenantes bacterium AC-335-B20]
MNLLQKFHEVIFKPNQTFKEISERPEWKKVLIVLLIGVAVYSFLIGPYKAKDSADMLRNNVKLQEKIGVEKFEKLIERTENPTLLSRIFHSFLFVPVITIIGLLISSSVIFGISRLFSHQGDFKCLFSSFLHANFIHLILGNIVRLCIVFLKKSSLITTSLAIFFPKISFPSTSFLILNQFDFFYIWTLLVLAFGIFYIFKITFKKSLLIIFIFWVIKSIVYIFVEYIWFHFIIGIS